MDARILHKYFPDLSEKQAHQFSALGELYADWNQKINVVSRKDIEDLYERHVLHSLAIAKFFQFPMNSRVLDIGTGGGFPGVPLAIMFPDSNFLLVDSIGKKIKVVTEVSSAIGLNNLKAEHQRAEKIKGDFDYIVSRAVAQTKMLMNWTRTKLKPSAETKDSSGYLLLKGGDLKEELKEIKRPYQEKLISTYFDEPFFETKKVIYIPMG
ncbi:16S rRNA (guanine(527)-N(7))-methyltransferase RsmG [Marinoscillum sp. MHG1-6]|uniref:16S rRNA (guanine(527)-N(7))-methyltransferase RsmG n=1 Tax=Marinoscillum sp. MHG1-6 TaxID=2959627 RepID=UPI0021573971|nr:16S rRNA (guanine(527)-N(7))-methyltransferase RsmG [Marinoscillum sp. MHG1-6]